MDSSLRMNMIPGLPNDLGFQCLAKVPYKSHHHLRAVCKSWNAVLSSSIFYKQRQSNNDYEEGIAYLYRRSTDWGVIIYYPHENRWERLPRTLEELKLDLSVFFQCNFVYVRSKQQLVVTGLPHKNDGKPTVLMFDFLTRTWRRGLDTPFHCSSGACAVSSSPEGLIYFAGYLRNLSSNSTSPHLLQAYAFNVEENNWEILPPMNPDRSQIFCDGEFVGHKFYVVPNHGRSLQIYDPQRRLWETINADNGGEHIPKCVSAFGKLYWFSKGGMQRRGKEYDFANNSFSTAVEYPAQFYAIDSAALCRDRIFLSAIGPRYFYHVVYFTFNILEREEEKRWTRIEMPPDFPDVILPTATAVQI